MPRLYPTGCPSTAGSAFMTPAGEEASAGRSIRPAAPTAASTFRLRRPRRSLKTSPREIRCSATTWPVQSPKKTAPAEKPAATTAASTAASTAAPETTAAPAPEQTQPPAEQPVGPSVELPEGNTDGPGGGASPEESSPQETPASPVETAPAVPGPVGPSVTAGGTRRALVPDLRIRRQSRCRDLEALELKRKTPAEASGCPKLAFCGSFLFDRNLIGNS